MADREVLKRRFVPAPLALAAWLLVLACSLAPAPALADGHFRYGTLSWAPSASGTENAVDFTLQVAYKKTYVWGGGLESWKENDDTPGSGFRNLAQAAAEDKAACDAWDKSGPRPEACLALTISPEVGHVIKFPAKALPSEGQCSDPLELAPTSNGCLPWAEAYGFYAGDGASKDVEVTVTESTSDVLSPLQNYIVGSGVFTHAYASPDNGGEAWVAHFSGGGRDSNLANNAGGRFRIETTVKIGAGARSPTASFIPIVPIPKTSGTAAQFQILAYDLSDLTKALTARDATAAEYGGVFGYAGQTTLSAANSPGKTDGISVAASTGLVTFDTDSKAAGLYNQVVMIENADSKIAVDFTMYVYEPVSFCHADCVTTAGLATFADADGIYGGCTICSNGAQSDYNLCTPVFGSQGCPGEGDTLTGVTPSEASCVANRPPQFVTPTPGIDEEGAASPAYPARTVVTANAGSDVTFEIAAEDPDSCSELEIRLVNPPKNAALMNVSAFEHQTTGRPSTRAIFVWPAPSVEARLDDRPKDSVVCFHAIDKYATSALASAYLHCVEVKIQAAPARTEQVLARFGCHMGLLWSPPIGDSFFATKGRFCFFDKSSVFGEVDSYTKHCSGADYEHKNWHNAYVSIEECGQDACPGKLFVDGKEVKNFTTSWGPQDCTKPLDVSAANGVYSPQSESKETSVCADPNCASCVSSMRIGAGCANEHNTFAHFDGYVDEVVIYNTTVGRAQIAQQLFHLPGHLPIDDFAVGARSDDIHEGVLAWYRFNDACEAAVETKTSSSSSSRRRLLEAPFSDQLTSYKKYLARDEWHNRYHGSAYAVGSLATPFKYVGAPWQTPTLSTQIVTANAGGGSSLSGGSTLDLEATGVAMSPFLRCVVLNKDNAHVRPEHMAAAGSASDMPADTFTNEYSFYSRSYQAGTTMAALSADGYTGYVTCNLPKVPLGRYQIGVSNNEGLTSGLALFGDVKDRHITISGQSYMEIQTEISGEYTIAAWFRPGSEPNTQYLFSMVDGQNQLDTAVYIEFGKITGLKDKFDMPIGQIDGLQDWHHIVFTTSFEGLTKTGARIYVDGKLESDMTGGASGGQTLVFQKFYVGGLPSSVDPFSGQVELDELVIMRGSVDTLLAQDPNFFDTIRYSLPVDYAAKFQEKYAYVKDYIKFDRAPPVSTAGNIDQSTLITVLGSASYAQYNPAWAPPVVLQVNPSQGPVSGGTSLQVSVRNLPDVHYLSIKGHDLVCVFYADRTESNFTYAGTERIDGKTPSMSIAFENPSPGFYVAEATKVGSNAVSCDAPAQSSPGEVRVAVLPKIPSGVYANYSAYYVSRSAGYRYELPVTKCRGDGKSAKNQTLDELSVSFGYQMGAWVKPEGDHQDGTVVSVAKSGRELAAIVMEGGQLAYRDDGILTARPIVAGAAAAGQDWVFAEVAVDVDGQGTLSLNGTVVSEFTTTSRPEVGSLASVCGGSFTGLVHGLSVGNVGVGVSGSSFDYIESEPAYAQPVTTQQVCASQGATLNNVTAHLVGYRRSAMERQGAASSQHEPRWYSSGHGGWVAEPGFAQAASAGTLVFWARIEEPGIQSGHSMFAYTASGRGFRGPRELTEVEMSLPGAGGNWLKKVREKGFAAALPNSLVGDQYLFDKELDPCEVRNLFESNAYSLRMGGLGGGLSADVDGGAFAQAFKVSMLVWPEEEGKNYQLVSSDALKISIDLGHVSVVLRDSAAECKCEPCSDVREFSSSVPAVSGRWSRLEVAYDGKRISVYLNGNEMDYADFETESFPGSNSPTRLELFSNFKGYVNALRIDKGVASGQEKYVCPLEPSEASTVHFFDFDFPFSGSEIPDLADEDVVLHNPGNEAAPTPVVSAQPETSLLSVSGDLQTISGQEACFRVEAYTACGHHYGGSMQPDFAVAFDDEEVTIRSVFDHQDGALEVCYSSLVCGTFGYKVSHSGALVKQGEVQVVAGSFHAPSTLVQAPSECENVEQSIFITARDANGCVLPDHSVQFEVDFVGPSTPVAAVTAAPDLGPGVYRATYVPVAQGSYQVKVTSAGEAAGSVQCTSHCEGHSLRVDGYGGVQIDEGSAHSPLDLAGAAFTAAAWVRRGPIGNAPAAQAEEGVEEAAGVGRRRLQQISTTANPPPASDHYVLFKGAASDVGQDVRGYFLGFSADWTELKAGVYVENEVSLTQKGEYRVVATSDGLTSLAVEQDLGSDDGWVHVACVYDGLSLKLYVGGLLRSEAAFADTRFGFANAETRPLTVGANFAGEIDEVLLTQRAMSAEELAGLMYCPVDATSPGVETAAYLPFNEGGLALKQTAVFRGLGAAFSGSFDAAGHDGRTAFGRSRPGSKVGVKVDGILSTFSASSVEASAGEVVTTMANLRDECGFAFVQDTSQYMQSLVQPFQYNNFRSIVQEFGSDRELGVQTTLQGATYTYHASQATTGSCASQAHHSIAFDLTMAGDYSVEHKVVESPFPNLVLVSLGKVDVHVSSAANFSTSTSDISGASLAQVGKPGFFLVTLRDGYGNVASGSGRQVALSSDSEGFKTNFGEHILPGVYKVNYVTTMAAPAGGYLIKCTVDGTELDASFQLNTESPQPLELWTVGGPAAAHSQAASLASSTANAFSGPNWLILDSSGSVEGANFLAFLNQNGLPEYSENGTAYVTPRPGPWPGYLAVNPNAPNIDNPVGLGTSLEGVAASVTVSGGAKSDGTYVEEAQRLKFDPSGRFYHKHLRLALTDPSGDVSLIEVNTAALPEVAPDCSGIAFVSEDGKLLEHYLHPYPGCKDEKTKFYVSGATSTTTMHYDSDSPSRSDPGLFGGLVMDMEDASSFRDAAFSGSGSLHLTGGRALQVTIEGQDALGPRFTVQAEFYDGMGPGTHFMNVSTPSGDFVTIGTDSGYSGSYVMRSSLSQEPEVLWSFRSRGWHTFSLVCDASGLRGMVDGSVRALQPADAHQGFVPRAVTLLPSHELSPVLWDQFFFTNKTVVPSEVTGGTSYTDAAYLEGSEWEAVSPTGFGPRASTGGQTVTDSASAVMYDFGGTRSGHVSGSVFALNLGADEWNFVEPRGPQPEPRTGYSACQSGDLVYVFGGRNALGQVLDDLWAFDTKAKRWTEETPKTFVVDGGLYSTAQLGGSYGHTCSVRDGQLVLFGGLAKATGKATNGVAILDLSTYQWRAGASKPAARMSHSAVVDPVSGSIFIFGGVTENGAELSDAWEFDLDGNRWKQLSYRSSLPVVDGRGGIFNHGAVLVNGKLLTFGGQSYGQARAGNLALQLYNIRR